ncbi:class I SAM-dependent methyltransferase [Deinococcus sp. KSM4-11]|uniref:class I SAM-dependent methyltransferase n=1 Tax=Deinococcus sp. KSM4-11 TaxID=2568654 RepID=UPI0010A31286|nr:class I SAM-dependent methyltransferase [Deinococcus sp. KSM4-11]THF83920.1 class I SAM-dependent methyltransferase [Deinococcus sp. KSM4-11]
MPDRPRHLHFDRVATLYSAARPGYPPALFDQLRAWGALRADSRVLELGPGSGQATQDLLDRGVRRIDALEVGTALARELQKRLPDPRLHVWVGDAHDLPLPEGAYDLCVAATSFHWLDAERMMPRLAAALRPGGWLAVWWTEFGDPDIHTPFRVGLDRLTRQWGMHHPDPPRSLHREDRVAELTQGGVFGNPRHALFRWSQQMTTDQVRALFATFPNFADRPDELAQIARLVDDQGGTTSEHYLTVLYAVQRAGPDEAAVPPPR